VTGPDPALPTSASRLRGLVRGPGGQPAWTRPALWAVVILAAVLYFWDLAISGWANAYYSAAAQAASQSWSAFFFGSFDASGFITVDKPPAALWLMGLSVRLFGLSSWSILVPEALCGVVAVVVLYLAVRRSFGAPAGVIAALVLALTPVAVAMFR
jgi:4-amino-4-deoxy-L-arabinose transferase-like glycosyltransferase